MAVRFDLPVILFASILVTVFSAIAAADYPDPCTRPCKEGGKRMVCRYRWVLENYLTLSRACYDCPARANQTDCLRQQCVAADGVQRSIRTINRQIPGPGIQVCEGDTIEVEVINQMVMSEGVTIHWHGILQRHSPHMDGVAMVTQCPITASSKFTYRFRADDPGTHLYHSHSGLFRGDGLFGSIVVRQPKSRDLQHDLYDLDLPEHVLVMTDWSHRPVVDLYAVFFHSRKFESQSPDSILINGRGVYPPTREVLVNRTTMTPFAQFHVQANRRYRFRLINAGALRCPIEFSVDDHHLLLIASDGRPFVPFSVTSVLMFSGERYDFVLQTRASESGVYWMRARGLDKCERDSVQQFAILKYTDHITQDVIKYPDAPMNYDTPTTQDEVRFNQWFLKKSDEPEPDEHAQITNMTSLEPDDDSLRNDPDQRIFLEFAYRLRPNYHFHDPVLYPARGAGYKTVSSTMINNISNSLPPAPILTQLDDLQPDTFCNFDTMQHRNCSHEFCECTHRVVAREGEVVELVIYNSNDQDGYTHPLHLHGHSYRVVAVHRFTEKITRERFIEMDRKGLIDRRLHAAPYKDTLPIPNGGFIVLRLKADNPGTWYMHCHVALHAEIGMALTFQVNKADGDLPASPPDFPRCGVWPIVRHADDVDTNSDVKGSQDENSSGNLGEHFSDGSWIFGVLAALVFMNIVLVVTSAILCKGKVDSSRSRDLHVHTCKSLRLQGAKARTGCVVSEDERTTLI
ncbi:uncharacterized protein [Littorina saxatilis]|uniref:Uncharacterized protein n=1 Tax=Littorina saxatilis TaxID=31220 RepID=A0AAN9ANY6_9CAEN